ncbi:hypothetical protein C2E23DRAFT_348430 [Lenzites betulinus]|nr:hypothetical protein C2E23DRAFT_348430 [Lenzites betulinus]
MPAFSRAVFLALQAAALVSLVGHPLSLAPSFALAAPVPLPMPLMPHLADYAAQPPARSSAASVPSSESISTVRRQDVAVVSHTMSTSSPAVAHEARGDTDTNILNNINLLGTMYSQMNDHSRVLNDLASRASTEGNSEEFRQDSVSQVTAYKTSLTSFTSILAALGADKGLANYDRSNELETMLKDIVNANKDAMSALYELVNSLPTLGPLLGPRECI